MQIEEIIEKFNIAPFLLYDAIEKSTDDYIYIIDMSTDEALLSENMAKDFELPGRFVNGLVPLWGALVHNEDKERYYESIEDMLVGKTSEHNVEYQVKNKKGEYVWVVCRGWLTRNQEGVPILFAGVVTNIGNKGKVDQTTGLFTHSECEKKIIKLLEEEDEGGILLLGLDDFKRINNLNHHIFGDVVLRQFAQVVQEMIPKKAAVFRFDGDQFAVVCPGATLEKINQLYQKISWYCNHKHNLDGVSYFCTVSGGIAMMQTDAFNFLELIKYAASALDASKRSGKNKCTAFSLELIEGSLRTQEIENNLYISITEGLKNFKLVYQPIVNSKDGMVHEAEALLRWSSEALGPVSPGVFVPVLESTGLIMPVGKWVAEQAIKQCKQWVKKCPDFVMNINVSYLQVTDREFISHFMGLLEQYELPAKHILLEMTESYFVTDFKIAAEVFQTLSDSGVRIAVDDFGTGYSSLTILADLPVDVIKIDRAFIQFIDSNPFNKAFIGAVVQLCHSIGIGVCAEGVETEEELDTVSELGADSIQGFYFSKPVPEDVFFGTYLHK